MCRCEPYGHSDEDSFPGLFSAGPFPHPTSKALAHFPSMISRMALPYGFGYGYALFEHIQVEPWGLPGYSWFVRCPAAFGTSGPSSTRYPLVLWWWLPLSSHEFGFFFVSPARTCLRWNSIRGFVLVDFSFPWLFPCGYVPQGSKGRPDHIVASGWVVSPPLVCIHTFKRLEVIPLPCELFHVESLFPHTVVFSTRMGIVLGPPRKANRADVASCKSCCPSHS